MGITIETIERDESLPAASDVAAAESPAGPAPTTSTRIAGLCGVGGSQLRSRPVRGLTAQRMASSAW